MRTAVSESMLIARNWVGDARITALRDTGCSGVTVKQQFVRHDHYIGHDGFIQFFDNSIKKVPISSVTRHKAAEAVASLNKMGVGLQNCDRCIS